MKPQSRTQEAKPGIEKAPTGIAGLDEITFGGVPKGRPTLVCGSAGCGKTLIAMEFLVRGATKYGEPGVFIAFEETSKELTDNVRSLGFDLEKLERQKKLFVDFVQVERSEILETGEYDLEGLFIRLAYAIDSIGAKRIVLDTLETLFSGLPNQAILRAELRRLFRWLKDRGVTAMITAERGDGSLTRQGLEEYVSDCVILLDHRLHDQVATRRLRVVKYRGTIHGTNEYPFLIDESGVEVLPITSSGLDHHASSERIGSGVGELDDMLAGGIHRGSTVLISGTAGTGKSSLSAHFVDASCARGERALYFAFEESPHQISRNMKSIGLDLQRWMKSDMLRVHASRPSLHGLESHLAVMHKQIREFKPKLVVVDPITNFTGVGGVNEVQAMLTRLVDFLKTKQITAVFTTLTTGGRALEATDVSVSSVVDTWLMVRDIELNGERNRALYVLKSRGTAHSNQIREFHLTSDGIRLREPYLGPDGVLTGSARLAQEAKESAAARARQAQIERKQRELEQRRFEMETKIAALRGAFESEAAELARAIEFDKIQIAKIQKDRSDMDASRKASPAAANPRLRVRNAVR